MTVPFEFVATGRPSSVNASTSKKAKWKRRVDRTVRIELIRAHLPKPVPAVYAAEVTVKVFYFPTNKQYVDIDNGLKHTIDALAPHTLTNDKLVQRLVVERFLPVPGSSMKVPITYGASLAKAFDLANGVTHPGRPLHATAVKLEPYISNGGALW